MRDFQISSENVTNGVQINSVLIKGKPFDISEPGKSITYGTILHLNLDSSVFILPLTETSIEIDWNLQMPEKFELRSGGINDSAFFIGYWFPQVVVYDDINGWDNLFYTGATETYNDISNFNVELKIPGDFLVWATGELQNPEDIYTNRIRSKIELSKQSDDVVHIISEEDLKTGGYLQSKQYHNWQFLAQKVPDFSFALSNKYIWDATSTVTNVKGNIRTWINVAYSTDTPLYKEVINYARKSINYFSDEFPGIPFPYPKHTTFYIAGNFGGMEFPMMAANGTLPDTAGMTELTAHEIAHTYFPFYVNTNEEKYAWMDEGWVTLFGTNFNESNGFGKANLTDIFVEYWNTENDIPLMTPSNYLDLYGLAFYYYEIL